MTNEKCVEQLKMVKLFTGYDKDNEITIRLHEALDMAIKALEAQSCEDCISRKSVATLVDELARAISDERCYISRGRSTATIMQDILDLPPVTPKVEWISCAERLPNTEEYIANNGLFIVTDGNRTYVKYFDVYDSMMYFGEPTMNGFRVDRCVIAWSPSPLPQPYKEGNDDK